MRSTRHESPSPLCSGKSFASRVRRRAQRLLPIAALLTGAATPLCFRAFYTVDGPAQALQTAILEASMTTPRYVADGMTYDLERVPAYLGHLPLMALQRFVSPAVTERVMAFLSAALVGLALLSVCRAHSTRVAPVILWAIPALFSFLLIMGFHHFHFGVALSLFALAWFSKQRSHPWRRWAGIAAALPLCLITHRGALPLLAIMLGFTIVIEHFAKRRPSTVPAIQRAFVPVMGMLFLFALGLGLLNRMLQEVHEPSGPTQDYGEWFLLRPLLLLDHRTEGVPVFVLGALLAAAIVLGLVARWRLGPRLQDSDSLLLLAMGILSSSLLMHGADAASLYLAERSQWLALLLMVPWLCAMYRVAGRAMRGAMTGVALMTLPVQFIRWGQAEASMAAMSGQRALVEEAARALQPEGLVLVGMAESNWVQRNAHAQIAAAHDGLLLPGPQVRTREFGDFDANRVKYRFWELANEPGALPAHWKHGQQPRVDQVVLLGTDEDLRAHWLSDWQPVLDAHYWKTYDNGYVVIWTAKPPG